MFGLFAAACTGSPAETGDTNDTTDGCVALASGGWSASGAAFGASMGMTLTADADACTFTLTQWSMDMGSMPESGTIAGEDVTLGGEDPYWTSCIGTATSDGTSISGICTDDDAAFMLESDG